VSLKVTFDVCNLCIPITHILQMGHFVVARLLHTSSSHSSPAIAKLLVSILLCIETLSNVFFTLFLATTLFFMGISVQFLLHDVMIVRYMLSLCVFLSNIGIL